MRDPIPFPARPLRVVEQSPAGAWPEEFETRHGVVIWTPPPTPLELRTSEDIAAIAAILAANRQLRRANAILDAELAASEVSPREIVRGMLEATIAQIDPDDAA